MPGSWPVRVVWGWGFSRDGWRKILKRLPRQGKRFSQRGLPRVFRGRRPFTEAVAQEHPGARFYLAQEKARRQGGRLVLVRLGAFADEERTLAWTLALLPRKKPLGQCPLGRHRLWKKPWCQKTLFLRLIISSLPCWVRARRLLGAGGQALVIECWPGP